MEFDDLTQASREGCELAQASWVESSVGFIAVKKSFRPTLAMPVPALRLAGYRRSDHQVRTWDLLRVGKNSLVPGLTRAQRRRWQGVVEQGVLLSDGLTTVRSVKLVEEIKASAAPITTLVSEYQRGRHFEEKIFPKIIELSLVAANSLPDVKDTEFVSGDREWYATEKCAERLSASSSIQDDIGEDREQGAQDGLDPLRERGPLGFGHWNYQNMAENMLGRSVTNRQATRELGEVLVAVCRAADIEPDQAFARVPMVNEHVLRGYLLQDT